MEGYLRIGEFAKLTGVTIKTVLHYHKCGLLPEAKRLANGYRFYGPVELNRMRSIKSFKNLGLSLEQIKEILGEYNDRTSFHDALLALQKELLDQIKSMNERLEKVQKLLDKEPDEPPSFRMVVDILGEEAQERFMDTCPDIYEKERQLYGVMDDLQWGIDYQDTFRQVAEYFRDHPEEYQQSLDYGSRITAIADVPLDSPAIEELARDYADYLMRLPFFAGLMNQGSGMEKPLESLFSDMISEVYSPSQMKMLELLAKYLEDGKDVKSGDQPDIGS